MCNLELVWTLGKRNESSGPGALTYCSNEDGCASPAMKRRLFYPRVQGHDSSVVRSPMIRHHKIAVFTDTIRHANLIILWNLSYHWQKCKKKSYDAPNYVKWIFLRWNTKTFTFILWVRLLKLIRKKNLYMASRYLR